MANGKAQKLLRNVIEGENLAANALTVAVGKVKEVDLQQVLDQIRRTHVANIEEAGSRLQSLGGKYPIPGLRDKLQKGWEAVASSKTSSDALKLLHKKEREALGAYKNLLDKAEDEQTLSLILRNMAATTENISKLGESLTKLQGKQKKGRILGLPRSFWLLGLASGAGYYFYRRSQSQSAASSTPASDAGSKS
jgi:hypothetical protein